MDNLVLTFNEYAHQLDERATQTRQATQLLKASGMAGGILGAVGLFGTGFAAVPLTIGVVSYLIGTAKEYSATGRFMPLPWSQQSGLSMAGKLVQESTNEPSTSVALTEYDYLNSEEKADYTLFTAFMPVVLKMVEGTTSDIERERVLTQARRTLLKHHPDLIQDPELLAPLIFGNLEKARAAFAGNLPEDLRLSLPEPIEVEIIEETVEAPIEPVEAPGGTHDLPTVLATKLRSTLVLGAPRAGKGYAVAKGTAKLPPNVDLWLIDPKNDPNESHYWVRVPKGQQLRFNVNKTLDPVELTERVMELFTRFLMAPSSVDKPKLLIIDECSPGLFVSMVKSQYQLMLGKVATIASVGPSQGAFVWIISQATRVDEVGLSKANRASLRICAVAKASGDNATEKSWLESVRDTVSAGLPAPELTGYIQMLDGQWKPAKPFTVDSVAVEDEPEPEDVEAPEDTREALKRMLSLEIPLSAEEKEIRRVSEIHGWVSASDVKRYASRGSSLRDYTADQIRELFSGLSDKGIGAVRGEANKTQWKVY